MRNKYLKAQAYLSKNGVEHYSDIESIQYVNGALVVTLACSIEQNGNVKGITVRFPCVSGFRMFDALDLARYWASDGFSRGSYLLEVTDGGWTEEENVLQGFEQPRREWLVVTGNGCVNAFCSSEPELSDAAWKYADR